MFNIKYKGKLKNLKQLSVNSKLPKGAIKFDGDDSIAQTQQEAIKMFKPFLIPLFIISFIRLVSLELEYVFNIKTIIFIAAIVLIDYLAIYIHELIHALCYPVKAEKTIWRYNKHTWLTYCNAPVSRMRFIIISLAPLIILGVIPYVVWLFTANKFTWIPSFLFLNSTLFFMISSCVDCLNVYIILQLVPKDAFIINHGIHGYWIKKK